MKTSGSKIFLKIFLTASVIILCTALFGLLFSRLSGINCSPNGTTGTLSGTDISLSLIFAAFGILFYFVCGLCALSGALGAVIVLLAFKLTVALAGFFGYASLIAPFADIYFLIISTVQPVLEAISDIPFLSARSDLLFVILPALSSLVMLASYAFGCHVRCRPEIVKRSLRRIDRFYDYRFPSEDDVNINIHSA